MTTTSLSCGLLVAVLAFPAGCATIVNRSTQPVTIVSDPPAAEVIVGAEGVGRTPTDVRLIRSDSDAALRLQEGRLCAAGGAAPTIAQPLVDREPRAARGAELRPLAGGAGVGPDLRIHLRRDGWIGVRHGPVRHRRRLHVPGYGADYARASRRYVGTPASTTSRHKAGSRFPPARRRQRASRRTSVAGTSTGSPMTAGPALPTSRRTPGCASSLAAAREP